MNDKSHEHSSSADAGRRGAERPTRRTRSRLGAAAALLAVAAVLGACGGGKEAATATAGEPRTVTIERVAAEALADPYELAGTLTAAEEAVVAFEADGRIVETAVDVGDDVEAEQPLARLDASQYELQLERADAAVLQAKAAVEGAEGAVQAARASLATSEAQVQGAEANLRQVESGAREQELEQARNAVDLAGDAYEKALADAERVKNLYDNGLTTLAEYENAQLGATKAEKDLRNAEAALSLALEGATDEQRAQAAAGLAQATAGKEAALATLQQAQAGQAQAEAAYQEALAAQRQAELGLSKTTLTAPVAGIVIDKLAAVGQLTGAGSPAFRIGKVDELYAILSVPDSDIDGWEAGQTIAVSLYGETREGTVATIYPTTSEGTGSINVKVAIPNPQLDWAPGQVVSAMRQNTGERGIVVPVEAVFRTGEEPFVFLHQDGKAVKTTVRPDRLVGNRLVIADGLKEGDELIVKGADGLLDGAEVRPAEEADE